MMLVLMLILGVALSTGYETEDHSVETYGNKLRIRLPWAAQSLKFFRHDGSYGFVLWNRSNPAVSVGKRGERVGNYFVIETLTQQDRGRYELRDKSDKRLSERSISVEENRDSIDVPTYEDFHYSFPLKQKSCNIHFIPWIDAEELLFVREGVQQWGFIEHACPRLQFSSPCAIYHEEMPKTCDGRFVVDDEDGNRAWELSVHVQPPSFDATPIIISVGVLCATIACCCCVKRCCCKKSSKKDQPQPNDPVLLRRVDLSEASETPYPSQPNAAPRPLIHNPPTVSVPPAYSQVSAPSEETPAPTVPFSFTPTVPPSYSSTVPDSCAVSSEFEPRFEPKGFTLSSYSPLSSASTEVSVYNSDKLNFL